MENSGVGCKIGPYYLGSLGYADDIILLNPTVYGSNVMLSIFEQYAKEHDIQFNTNKSQVIVFSSKKQHLLVDVKLNGKTLKNVNKVKHLGHVLNNDCHGYIDPDNVKYSFVKSVNLLIADLGSLSSNLLIKLFMSYRTSLYGVTLCDITAQSTTELEVMWRKCLRRVMRVHPRTHNDIVHLLSGNLPLHYIILMRILSFVCSIHISDNYVCRFFLRCCYFQTVSNLGKNVKALCALYDTNPLLSANKINK